MKAILSGRSAEAVGKRLILTRRVWGLSQQDFAAKAEISPSAYNQYENAKRLISVSHAHKLCDAYDLTLDWIYRGDPSSLRYQTAAAIRAILEHAT